MAIAKPLREEEVPEEYRDRIWFKEQYQESYRYKDRLKMRSMVWINCDICLKENPVTVNDVRRFLSGIRKQFPGTHRACKYPGKHSRKDGYVMLYRPDHPHAVGSGYVMEHILVMEEALGRYLNREIESVHHIDGDNSNNSIENLQLRFKYHGKGQAWKCNDCGSNNVQPTEL